MVLATEISVQTCPFPHWCKILGKSSVYKTTTTCFAKVLSTFICLFLTSSPEKKLKKKIKSSRAKWSKASGLVPTEWGGGGCSKTGVQFKKKKKKNPIIVPVSIDWHLLDVWVCSSVYEGFSEGAQDVSRDPALRSWWLAVRGSKHQVHVLLVRGQYLHCLTLRDTDLVLFQCVIVLSHHQGGRRSVTSHTVKLLWERQHTHTHTHTKNTYMVKTLNMSTKPESSVVKNTNASFKGCLGYGVV